MIWLLLYPLTLVKQLIGGLFAWLLKRLLRYDTFRRRVIYPKLGIQYDSSIKRTVERPILHAEIDGGKYHFPVFANQTRIDHLRRSRLRETDVLVVTYPKSGTHLCGYIVKLLAEKRNKIMQDAMVLPFYELINQAELDSVPAGTQRILKTHLPLDLLPQCSNTRVQNKIIFCLRDPKDACISYYKFTLQLEALTGPVYETFDEWVELWLGGCVDYGDWFDYVLPYWGQRHRPNYLIVSYENILHHPDTVIRQIAEHLDYDVDQTEIAEIKDKIKFSNMKQTLQKTANKQATNLMRQGKIGENKTAFSKRHHLIFNRMFREKMGRTDFDLYNYGSGEE